MRMGRLVDVGPVKYGLEAPSCVVPLALLGDWQVVFPTHPVLFTVLSGVCSQLWSSKCYQAE